MKKTLTISTLVVVAIAGAVMAFAGVTAPRTSATPSLCHSAKPSITAPTSVAARTSVKITGSVGSAPAHGVSATLQSKLSTSKKWVTGATGKLKGGGYSLKWKAPAKKGTYLSLIHI